MTDSTLLTDDHDPGPRRRLRPDPRRAGPPDRPRGRPRAWLRRLYTHPDAQHPGRDGLPPPHLRRRAARVPRRPRPGLPHAVVRRPHPPRRPRHRAPSTAATTSAENGQGLCEACNYAKEAAGWRALPLPSDRHEVLITTPTGHTYVSTAPDPPQPYVPPPDEAGDVVHFYSARRTARRRASAASGLSRGRWRPQETSVTSPPMVRSEGGPGRPGSVGTPRTP